MTYSTSEGQLLSTASAAGDQLGMKSAKCLVEAAPSCSTVIFYVCPGLYYDFCAEEHTLLLLLKPVFLSCQHQGAKKD